MRRSGSDGSHWDTAKIRRAREFGWFKQHEPEMIEEARRRAATPSKHPLPDRCPACGREMTQRDSMQGVEVRECRFCNWISVDRDELAKRLADPTGGSDH